jgi:hypothetical protein
MGVTCPCPVIEYVFSSITEAGLGLSAAEIIACSFDKCTVAEASVVETGRIRLKTRTMASKAGRGIFLFSIAVSY